MIILVGLALGLANYSLGVYESLGRSMVLQVIISLLIGYPSLVIGHNARQWWPESTPSYRQQLWLLPAFFLLGLLATEGQLLADYLLFNVQNYRPFQAGGVYLFNGILSGILGMMLKSWRPEALPPAAKTSVEAPGIPRQEPLTKIPLRKGETTAFMALEDIIYFEAYDNYSFLHDSDGQRSLCNYSLVYLESRLDDRFLRVHRKYLINTGQIAGITPHLKGRYVITFTDTKSSSIRSSAGYTDRVKALLQL
ncbi:LytTR family DNA-binding domain-containing protein [Neolewinella persica]|uniref:LytTR family DNA-binding domain-containing protein n=1 Tax=Neolewinella persica TaxID=70998 RepID=UPI0003773267|nr:LytTR family DNA-binding domain-containing protein [Neolewinella persica]